MQHRYTVLPDSFNAWNLLPDSFNAWNDIANAFLNEFIYDGAANLEIEMEYILRYQIDMAQRDEYHGSGEPNRAGDVDTGDLHLASTDTATSESINTNSCYRSTTIEIPESSNCSQNIADSRPESTDISSSFLAPDVDREITMEDFLELEEFLDLGDGESLKIGYR